MSTHALKFEIEGRRETELLPAVLPIEMLIALTKKLAQVVDRSLAPEELNLLAALMRGYLGRVVGMHGVGRQRDFEARAEELLAALVQELYDCMCEEIVSRLIGYDVRTLNLQARVLAVLDEQPAEVV